VDTLKSWKLFQWINGPAGSQLGTEPDGLIAQLGEVDFELGIITGDRSLNWINSLMITGSDDGKVSVESAQIKGMKAFKVIHSTHIFIMRNKAVMRDVISFLKTGAFEPEFIQS
jgi:hypothetical protein